MSLLGRRRLMAAAAALAVAPLLHAQAPRVRRIGILLPSAGNAPLLAPYRKRLNELGWVEGNNLAIEVRNAENRYERLPALVADLLGLKVEVIVTASTPVTRAARDATAVVPIVFSWVGDPVGTGLVASLGRPGANLTGTSNLALDIAAKQLELLRTFLPELKRVAELRDPKFEGAQRMSAQFGETAAQAGITLIQIDASSADDLERAFAIAARERALAMVIPPLPLYGEQRQRIAQLAKQYRIATVSQFRSFVAAGGLLSYGSDLTDGFLRTAKYVDRILRGTRPADLPVEQADRFETVVNRRTAAELGLRIPPAVLLRADDVID